MTITTRYRRVLLHCSLGVLICLVAACSGDDGNNGPPGPQGASCWDTNGNGAGDLPGEDVNRDGVVNIEDCSGEDGTDGTDGQDGTNGVACWDINMNGLPDVQVEDRNQDGRVDVNDCQGQDGQDGEDGQDGGDGQDGTDGEDGLACWDRNGNGQGDLPAEDTNGDGVVDVDDCGGSSTGLLAVEVMDARSGALLAAGQGGSGAATVTLDPPVAGPSETDEFGRVLFPDVPAGVYTITASAPALALEGTTVVPTQPEASSPAMTRSIVAGSSQLVRLLVPRLAASIPLVALHDVSWSAGAAYVNGNCTICHGSKLKDRSRDPDVPGWHSIRNASGNAVHASVGCTFCHTARVDLIEASASSLRKQVDIARCKVCHPSYPSFP